MNVWTIKFCSNWLTLFLNTPTLYGIGLVTISASIFSFALVSKGFVADLLCVQAKEPSSEKAIWKSSKVPNVSADFCLYAFGCALLSSFSVVNLFWKWFLI